MRTALTRRVLDMLERLAGDDVEKYAKFWQEFGPLLKEGLVEDAANRERIAKLLRFNTTRSTGIEQDRSLKQYLEDAKPEQDVIYYLVAESPNAARSSPHLEAFREHDVEVLLLSDRLDEWVMQHLTEFEGKSLPRREARQPRCGRLGRQGQAVARVERGGRAEATDEARQACAA